MRYIMTLLLSLVLVGPAMAKECIFVDTSMTQAPHIKGVVNTSAAIREMSTGKNVILEGRVSKSGRPEYNYILQDSTGSVPVQIDSHLTGRYNFDNYDVVRVDGTVEYYNGANRMVNANIVELRR